MSQRLNVVTTLEELQAAYDGSYYFIAGAGGEVTEWIDGVDKLLRDEGIGQPTCWWQVSGALVNEFAGSNYLRQQGDPFQPDITCLMFPLDGLDIARLAIFKLKMEDRWFDDVIQNMRMRNTSG